MVTQIEEQETKQEQKRIFTGLNTSRLNQSTTTEYRRPNFSDIDFEPINFSETITSENPVTVQKNTVSVSEEIISRPSTRARARLNARGKIILSVAIICICALMAFMIGNAVTISGLNGSIAQKQQLVAQQQQVVSDLYNQSQKLDEDLYDNAINNGYGEIDAQDVVQTGNISKIDKPKAEIESNWFDNLCNWFAGLFN